MLITRGRTHDNEKEKRDANWQYYLAEQRKNLLLNQSEKGKTTLYIKYINAGNTNADGVQYTTFEDDEILLTEETFSLGTTVIQENTDFAKCVTSQATFVGSSAKITAGIYFIKGNFVTVPEQEVVLDQFGVTPSYRVGLQVLEEIITQPHYC
mgnify:CR=1 FL=1